MKGYESYQEGKGMASRFIELLKKGSTIVFDGGMGTSLFDHGIFINRCFDQINLTDPNLIKQIHSDFAKAGAMVLETNTFGANRFKLSSYDLSCEVVKINEAGVLLAKEVAGDNLLVAGSVGPLGIKLEPLFSAEGPCEVKEAFIEQIDALACAGADLIILETFSDIREMKKAITAVFEVREKRKLELPVICSFTVNKEGNTIYGACAEEVASSLEKHGVDVIGLNCSVGPKPMLEVLERIRNVVSVPLCVMPNAGIPTHVEGRTIYVCSPDYMANYARRYVQQGAKIVGGCCGTTPEHIKKICSSVRQLSAEKRSLTVSISNDDTKKVQPKEEIPLKNRSSFGNRLAMGKFVSTVELTPPQGFDLKKILNSAKLIKESGYDAINIPDGPRASARMSPLATAVLIEKEANIETIMHYACRDRNLVGMQSDLLGAYALGLRNILVVTGDPPIMGDYPHATAVFDIDAIGLTSMISKLNTGLDLSGRSINEPTGFVPMVGLNPSAINLQKELERFGLKVKAGAKAVITQPVFDEKQLISFLEKLEGSNRIPVIAGIWPLQSLRNAEFLANEMPGVSIPASVLEKMAQAQKNGTEREVGEAIAIELMEKVLPYINGIQVAAPFGRITQAIAILKAAKQRLNIEE